MEQLCSSIKEQAFVRQYHTERMVAAGRALLALAALIALWLDPSEPAQYAPITTALAVGYLVYAVVIALVVWRLASFPTGLRYLTYGSDVLVCYVFMYFTAGPASPFFVFFVFALLCATLYWQWRGALWTAVVTLTALLVLGIYARGVSAEPAFDLNYLILRSVHLLVTAVFLGYIGAYQQQLSRDIAKLAVWPAAGAASQDMPALVAQWLQHVADILRTSRVLMHWEESEEPYVYIALWAHGQCDWQRQPPGTGDLELPAPLTNSHFLCRDVRASHPLVLYYANIALQRWQGVPLPMAWCERYAVRSVLALRLHSEHVQGWLFCLDPRDLNADALLLGSLVAREIETRLEQQIQQEQEQQATVMAERLRLARDLHDNVAQALTGAALYLETARRLLGDDSPQVADSLQAAQRLLVAEQQSLRLSIQELRLAPGTLSESGVALQARLEELRKWVEQQWGIHVVCALTCLESDIPKVLQRDLYHMAREAVLNAARHAHATTVWVELGSTATNIVLCVRDNGHGFPFYGHYDLDTLGERHLGPLVLRERVASVGGSLCLDSAATGSTIRITVPQPRLER